MTQPKNRNVAIEPAMFDEATRTLTLSYASQEPVSNWGEREVLIISQDAMDTSRFENGVMPVLFNHNRDAIIASINKLWIENSRAYATITFDEDEESLKIMNKVKSGSCRGVSVGYKPKIYEIVEKDAISAEGISGPCYIARKWEVLEFSIVSVPADPTVAAGRQDGKETPVEIIVHEEKEEEMRDEEMTLEEKAREEAEKTKLASERLAEQEKARMEERKRISEINTLCRDFDVDEAQTQGFINENTPLDVVRSTILDLERKSKEGMRTSKVKMGADEESKRSAAMSDAILLRAGIRLAKPADGANDFRSMRMRDLAIDALERAGESRARHFTDDELFKRALTSGALGSVLSNAANKSLSAGYAEAATTYREFTTIGNLTDFKIATRYKISAIGEPTIIPENGEFTYDKVSDEGVGVQLQTAGKGFTYTRQMFINDDLGVLTKMPAKVNAAFERMKNRLVYDALATSTLYTSGQGNLAGTAAAISVASVGAGRAAMRKMKDASSKAILNVAPRYIVVPAALETVAYQLINSTADPSGTNAGVVNPFGRNTLIVVADGNLDAKSLTSWYMVAEKGVVDTIEVSYLNGVQAPILESGLDPDVLGWKFRIYHDFNVKALDFRGLYKNAGV